MLNDYTAKGGGSSSVGSLLKGYCVLFFFEFLLRYQSLKADNCHPVVSDHNCNGLQRYYVDNWIIKENKHIHT